LSNQITKHWKLTYFDLLILYTNDTIVTLQVSYLCATRIFEKNGARTGRIETVAQTSGAIKHIASSLIAPGFKMATRQLLSPVWETLRLSPNESVTGKGQVVSDC
jgi:hypothetical protein